MWGEQLGDGAGPVRAPESWLEYEQDVKSGKSMDWSLASVQVTGE